MATELNHQLVLPPDARISCPKCANEFALSDGFARQALEGIEAASLRAMAVIRDRERAASEKQAQQLAAASEAAHQAALASVRKLTEDALAPQLLALRTQLADSQGRLNVMDQREAALQARERSLQSQVTEAAAIRAAELVAGERGAYEKRLAEQSAQVQKLQAEQLALREERQQLQDQKSAMALDVQRQVDARIAERTATLLGQEQERSKFKEAELQKTIDDVRAQLAEMQAKASQGSQQTQGEVLELAMEENLRRAFPLDRIEEVKKGQRGGDVLQHVSTRGGHTAGVILWETKRARDWSAQWIVKLKDDMRASGATVGILVTMPGTLPKDWPERELFALYDDVWVTQYSTAIGVAEALRTGLLEVQRQRAIAAGKGEKMEALYDYLTSPQFAHKLKAVYETFTRMREELEQEKSVTLQRWARREKQLATGVTQLLGMGGEIQGLAQQDLPMLNLQSDAEGT